MEPYRRGRKEKLSLPSLAEETSKGVGITGASAPSRALLGLKALYAAVDVDRRKRARLNSGNQGCASTSHCGGGSIIPSPDGAGAGMTSFGGVDRTPRAETHCMDGDGRGGGWPSMSLAPQLSPLRGVSPDFFADMPLLGHRYRYVSTIGKGRFSDVIRADDTFRPGRSVAIKVMNVACGAIAVREVRLMRFLGSIPNAEYCPVVRLLDVFTYRGRYCLVMELFDSTLSQKRERGAAAPGPAKHDFTTPDVGPPRGAASHLFDQTVPDAPGCKRLGIQADSGSRSAAVEWGIEFGEGGLPMASSTYTGFPRSIDERMGGQRTSSEPSSGAGCPTHVIRHVALQLVSALLLLHNHGLIHADIKPENVLLQLKIEDGCGYDPVGDLEDSPTRSSRLQELIRGRVNVQGLESLTVRLCDFGNTIHKSEAYLYYGDFEIQTLAYRAPEVLMGCPFGPAVDAYSVGIILLELLIGRPMFHTACSRAALLQQTLCAFGPVPLRRFRVGQYFSQYFAQDQSLKVGISSSSPEEEHERTGCCSCCWKGDYPPPIGGAGRHVYVASAGSSCDGCCAQRCGRQDQYSEGSTRFGVERRRGLGSAGSARSSTWGVAHAHLTRLVSAAGAVSPTSNCCDEKWSSIDFAENRCQPSARVCKPRPRRFGASSSGIARPNPRLLSLLAGLLCFDPDERLTPLQALAHPFFLEALPFAFPPTMTSDADRHPSKAPSVEGRPMERADGNLESSAQIGDRANVLASASATGPRATARPAAHLQESSPSLGFSSRTCVNNAPYEAASSGKPQGNSGQDRIREEIGAAAALTARSALSPRRVAPSVCTFESDNTGSELEPTARLQRLAEMAEVIVRKGEGGGTREGDGSSETPSTVPLSSPRRNPFLNASILAKLKREEEPFTSGTSGVSGTSRLQMYQQANHGLATTPSATITRRRKRNRFLSPATLALLNPELGLRTHATTPAVAASPAVNGTAGKVREGATLDRFGLAKRSTTTTARPKTTVMPLQRKSPRKRDTFSPPQEANASPSSTTSTRAATRATLEAAQHQLEEEETEREEDREDHAQCEPRGPTTTSKRGRSRKSAKGDRTRAAGNSHTATSPMTRGGRTTTPRRAAVAAEKALMRLREDDESSDGSMTL